MNLPQVVRRIAVWAIVCAPIALSGCGSHPATVASYPDPEDAPKFELTSLSLGGKDLTANPLVFQPGQQVDVVVEVSGNRDDFFRFGRQPADKIEENNSKPLLRFRLALARPSASGEFHAEKKQPYRSLDIQWKEDHKGRANQSVKLPNDSGDYELWLSYAHHWMMMQPGRMPFTKEQSIKKVRFTISGT